MSLTLNDVRCMIDFYKLEYQFRKILYATRKIKTFINRPFPPDVSENLVKFYVQQVEQRECIWTVDANHDLFLPATNRKLEVKAFNNVNEQVTFTCSQDFDVLYVLDCRNFFTDKYNLHIFSFSSSEMGGMEIGIDSLATRQLNEEKRTVRVSLKRLMKFAKEKGYCYEMHSMKFDLRIVPEM